MAQHYHKTVWVRALSEGFEIFDARAGVKQDDGLAFMYVVAIDKFPECRQAGGALGGGKDAGRGTDLVNRGDKVVIADGDGGSARGTYCVKDQKVADRFWHTKAGCD